MIEQNDVNRKTLLIQKKNTCERNSTGNKMKQFCLHSLYNEQDFKYAYLDT